MVRSSKPRGILPSSSFTSTSSVDTTSSCASSRRGANNNPWEVLKEVPCGQTADVKIIGNRERPRSPLIVAKRYKSKGVSIDNQQENLRTKHKREYDVLNNSVHPNIVKLVHLTSESAAVSSPPQPSPGHVASSVGNPHSVSSFHDGVAPHDSSFSSRSSAPPSTASSGNKNNLATIYLELMDLGSLKDVCTKLRETVPALNGTDTMCGFAKAIAVPCLLGLQYLHAKEIIHRDVKPENILLSMSGRVKLCDFDSSSVAEAQTVGVGTCGYEAPELLTTTGLTYTDKVDIWSLGCVLYWIVQGELPRSLGDVALISRNLTDDPDWEFSSCFTFDTIRDEALQALMKGMLQTKPERRFSAAEALRHAALSPFYSGCIKLTRPHFNEDAAEDIITKFSKYNITVCAGCGTEEDELCGFLKKGTCTTISKENRDVLREGYKQILFSRQKQSVDYLVAFLKRWANDEKFYLVKPCVVRNWRKLIEDAATVASPSPPSRMPCEPPLINCDSSECLRYSQEERPSSSAPFDDVL